MLIVSSAGCASVSGLVVLMLAFPERTQPQTAPDTYPLSVDVLELSPRGTKPISGPRASVRVAVSVPPTAMQPYMGVCLGRSPSTIVIDSCSWAWPPRGDKVMSLSPTMPRVGPGPLFTESGYVTAVLMDARFTNLIAPPGVEVPLASLAQHVIAYKTVARTWRWK
jgi:hypothetical protein